MRSDEKFFWIGVFFISINSLALAAGPSYGSALGMVCGILLVILNRGKYAVH